ncbi:hypothetical protein AR688_00635 [Rheinheimera sp. EpRS3]|nr:hypothetical protein AR688_00635 [Rheinheimera sp. EpRS3]
MLRHYSAVMPDGAVTLCLNAACLNPTRLNIARFLLTLQQWLLLLAKALFVSSIQPHSGHNRQALAPL